MSICNYIAIRADAIIAIHACYGAGVSLVMCTVENREKITMAALPDTLDELMSACLTEGAYCVAGGRELYMEVMDSSSGLVWMSAAPVTEQDFNALEFDPPLVKVGIAPAAMDSAAFQYSPEAPGKPVQQRLIDGRLYINVAAPVARTLPKIPGGPLEIAVDKAHVVGFDAGRSVTIMSLPEGDFVELVGHGSGDHSLVLPQGAALRRIELTRPWVVTLPTPTRAFFWFGESMRSFQGPVTLPEAGQCD